MKCSRTSQTPIGISLRLNLDISNSCARSSGQCRSVQQEIEGEWTFGLGDMVLSPTMIDYLEAAHRFLLREPERSRRVLRLLCAHYLAHAGDPRVAAAETGRLGQVLLPELNATR